MNVCASRRDCMNRYVYSRRDCMNVCASRREHNSRNSIVMARHHTIRIIVPIRTLIRFWQFLINKITEFSDPDDKIIGKNYLPGCNQFGNFCRGENRFHDNRGGGDEESVRTPLYCIRSKAILTRQRCPNVCWGAVDLVAVADPYDLAGSDVAGDVESHEGLVVWTAGSMGPIGARVKGLNDQECWSVRGLTEGTGGVLGWR